MMRMIVLIALLTLFAPRDAGAFWMWTPETNKWVNPKWAVKDTPQEQLAFALEAYQAKDYKGAIKELNKLIKHYPRAKEAAEAQYYIAVCYEEQNLLFKAFQNYQIVIEKYPFSDRASDIVRKEFEIGNAILEGKDERSGIISTIVGGDYDVIEVFRAVIKNAPYSEYAPPAQYKIGLYLQEKQLYQEARDEFEKTVNDYPDSEWAKAARYQIAVSDAKRSSGAQYDQKVTKAAIEEFEEFVSEYPEARLSENAKHEISKLRDKEAENNFVIAQYYEKRRQFNAAKIYYADIVDGYRDTTWAKRALEKIQKLNSKIK